MNIVEEGLPKKTLCSPEHCELCSSAAEEHLCALVRHLKGRKLFLVLYLGELEHEEVHSFSLC